MKPVHLLRSVTSVTRATVWVALALMAWPVVSSIASETHRPKTVADASAARAGVRSSKQANLQVLSATVKLAGRTLVGSATIENLGVVRARSSTGGVAWKSTNSGGLIQVGKFAVPALKPDQRHKAHFQIPVTKNSHPGVYTVSICADVLDHVQESNKKDRCHKAGIVTVGSSGVKGFKEASSGSSAGTPVSLSASPTNPVPASPTPASPLSSPPDTTIDSGPSGVLDSTTAGFAFSSSQANSTFQCKLDADPWEACTSPQQYTALAQGAHTFQVRAINAEGEPDPTPAQASWSVETTLPILTLTSAEAKVMVGSVTTLALPEQLRSVASVEPATGTPAGVTVEFGERQFAVAASAEAVPGTNAVTVTGVGCTPAECGVRFVIEVPVTVTPLASPSGTLESFTTPSPDRIAAAVHEELSDELIITLGSPGHPGNRAQADAAAAATGGVVSGGISEIGVYEIRWPTPQNLPEREAELEAQEGVTAVSGYPVEMYGEDSAYPVAPQFESPEWTWPFEQVDASAAWQESTGSSVRVGIIDAGLVFNDHEDLNVAEILSPPAIYFPAEHATHVAGLACAKGKVGTVGMAWGCPIVSTAVGTVSNTTVLQAMNRMVKHGNVKVVNISLGTGPPNGGCATQAQDANIARKDAKGRAQFRQILAGEGKNIVWTLSAGNNCSPGVASEWAANSDLSNVIAVGATKGSRLN